MTWKSSRTERHLKQSRSALAVLLWFLALVSSSLAGPPTHLRKESLDISGFDHACGTAVDSKGDVYVSSAGGSKIKIFDPAHTEVAFIEDVHTPCGLAVDTNGNLYVLNLAPHEVVKYHPSSYPPTGSTTYESTAVDNSASARGISVDPADDLLYVAEGSRIATYDEGALGINEVQRLNCFECTGGSYRLSFGGQKTGPISFEGPAVEVQTALEALSIIGVGNVSVEHNGKEHFVTFQGTLAHMDVESLEADSSELIGGADKKVIVEEEAKGFSGHISEDNLTNATGVAAYTYKVNGEKSNHYVFAVDSATDTVKVFSGVDVRSLKLRKTIGGPKPGEDFGFGPAGAYLAADPGNHLEPNSQKCESIAEQACTAGHFFIYDDSHKVIDEFEAEGEFLDQFTNPDVADAEPTALAVDRSGGANDGTIYVTVGPGPNAKLLAFGPLVAPTRPQLAPPLSHVLEKVRAVATDSFGDVYVAAGKTVSVYDSTGEPITEFADEESPGGLSVDSTGRVYVLDSGLKELVFHEKVTYYTPAVYPPTAGTNYTRHEPPIATRSTFEGELSLNAIAVNPANNRLFVTNNAQTIEFDSVEHGSGILNPKFASGLVAGERKAIAVNGANGDVYIATHSESLIYVLNSSPSAEILAEITGAGSHLGLFGGSNLAIAVDQSDGHVVAFSDSRGSAEEFDASGSFVANFGKFTNLGRPAGVAIDNSSGPGDGNVYVAFDDTASNTFDLTAFGPLGYGESPSALTGVASSVGSGAATLNGTVDPHGFDLTDCHFEYLTEAEYIKNGETFVSTQQAACVPGLKEIGHGTGPVAVHADVTGLDPEARYRFRLLASNKYGEDKGEAGLFGPPVLAIEPALPVLYTEATLRAGIDTSGLATKYRFEYLTDLEYKSNGESFDGAQDTPEQTLSASPAGPEGIKVPLTGLTKGTEYHFRIVVENEAKVVEGADQTLVTLERRATELCSNSEYRTGLSANLPDCRAYELVTPAQTNGAAPYAADSGDAGRGFNNWLVAPSGAEAGESLSFYTDTALPGFESTGRLRDGYRAQRAQGEGPHPALGWTIEHPGPTYEQVGGGTGSPQGVASDQHYAFWATSVEEVFEETLPEGVYLRTPNGFEAVGKGSFGTDLKAESRFVSTGGAHVIFSSEAQLEPNTPLAGTEAIYDRTAGASSGEVVSVKPDGSPFGAGEDATYLGATEDGTIVAFEVGGALYLHREGTTTEVAAAPDTFAGISEDGKRVFYAKKSSGKEPGPLYACDVEAGPCVGGVEPPGLSRIATNGIFVNVSTDGSHVLFTSEEALTGSEENEAGEVAEAGKHNLYVWDGADVRFAAILALQDLVSFEGFININLSHWTTSVTAGIGVGRGYTPARSTPDGDSFVFQSHAQLTSYDNTETSGAACGDPEKAGDGCSEIYRYDPAAAPGEQLTCVSCDPSGTPPSADATLQSPENPAPVKATTLIPNLTDDGQEVLFQSSDRLVPEDANGVQDVYEWKAKGAGDCGRPRGCLALISSGQGEKPNYLYSMTPDGHDVFFTTLERLVGADIAGSPSIYDARVNGGTPEPLTPAPCRGDACQGSGSTPPTLLAPASTGSGNGNVAHEGRRRCPKGKHRVKGRCVRKHHKRRRRHRRANNQAAQR